MSPAPNPELTPPHEPAAPADPADPRRRALLGQALAALALPAGGLGLSATAQAAIPAAAAREKVLRVAFNAGETGFDPIQVSDLYSHTICAHLFESLCAYDHLARPFKVKPRTAEALPVAEDDFKTWTVRIRPGIFFAEHPAFGGRRRELTAEDYAYTFKRYFDPRWKSPAYAGLKEEGVLGLDALRERALKDKTPFDYDAPVEGLRVLDRHVLQFRLEEPRPRFLYTLGFFPAMAREVVERAGEEVMAQPVGTGPFVLGRWRRSSLIELKRNPGFREMVYDAEPNADDAEGQAILAALKGKRLPIVDRVEVSIIEETQPRWLAFLNGQLDLGAVPGEFIAQAAPNGVLAPNLAKRGIRMQRNLGSDVTMTMFNMEHPVLGGLAPEKVALRRAIGLGIDLDREIRIVRRGQAVPAQAGLAPNTYGYDPQLKTENSDFNPARAHALLDLYGYARGADGWRRLPDGGTLELEVATQSDAISRQFDELWKKNMDALGLRTRFRFGQWPEQLKAARAGNLMIWGLGSSASSPDGQDALERGFGPSAGGGNLARFKLEEYDATLRKMSLLPDGEERLALFRKANRILLAYMPYKFNVHRIATDLAQPWLIGYKRPTFWSDHWHQLDIDLARQAAG